MTASKSQVALLPTLPTLIVEFDPHIRLGEILQKLGPEYLVHATCNGPVRVTFRQPHRIESK